MQAYNSIRTEALDLGRRIEDRIDLITVLQTLRFGLAEQVDKAEARVGDDDLQGLDELIAAINRRL